MNVETTAPNWFSLQSEPAKSQATLQRVARPISAEPLPRLGNSSDSLSLPFRQSATTATQNSASELAALSKKLREITPVQLIATIYYNQGVDLLQTEEYAEAALANVKALHLDPGSETAWVNLMATLNNWAIELTTEFKRYDLAAVLLDQGVYLDPHYDKFSMNQVYIYYYWMQELAMEGRVADAKVIFNYANQRVPNNQNLTQLMQWVSTL